MRVRLISNLVALCWYEMFLSSNQYSKELGITFYSYLSDLYSDFFQNRSNNVKLRI